MSPRTLPALVAAAAVCCAAVPATAGAAMVARGSIEQAYVADATPKAQVALLRGGKVLARGRTDRFGSKVFYDLRPGSGYRIRVGARTSKPFGVLRAGDNPKAAFYRGKTLKAGLNYVTMRDGIELAMTVRLPAGKTLEDGPFPTVIEYSGYQTAAPNSLIETILTGKSDPLAPASSTAVGSLIAPLLGYATVSVQMRGSGCSGGAFDLFGLPTTYDGYDAVETVAAQPWSKGKVGMVGISFSGITQLFTGGTQPPNLAAITPMSVTDDIYTGTGNPGGIANSGFARSWVSERLEDAEPAPAGGQPYARELVKRGDKRCTANQRLRLQTRDALQLIETNPFRTPSLFDDRAPGAWLSKVEVPVFFVGSFQDEQTGGHFAESLAGLRRNKRVWITMQNGVHADSLGPDVITRWTEFLGLYVANQIPEVPGSVLGLGSQLYEFLASAPAKPVQQTRFAGTSDVAAARATFERDPRVRLLMDNGAAIEGKPGAIGSPWELGFGAWPVSEAQATTWWLGGAGALVASKPAGASTAAYTADPKARPTQSLPGRDEGSAWKAQPPYDWRPVAAGKGLGWTSPVLTADAILAGPSSLDVWLRSSAKDTDLQATISEVRPDGAETYVQTGWLRASHRKLDARRSTAVDPFPTHLERDAAPIPAGKPVLVRVPIWPAAHAFRAGSRIRVTLQAPGGDRPRWRFDTVDEGTARNTVLLGGARASKLVLSLVPGATAKGSPLPLATALRGQPSRAYAAASNGG